MSSLEQAAFHLGPSKCGITAHRTKGTIVHFVARLQLDRPVIFGAPPPNRTATFCSSHRCAHQIRQRSKLAGKSGIEPLTVSLTGSCSASELRAKNHQTTMYNNRKKQKTPLQFPWRGLVFIL